MQKPQIFFKRVMWCGVPQVYVVDAKIHQAASQQGVNVLDDRLLGAYTLRTKVYFCAKHVYAVASIIYHDTSVFLKLLRCKNDVLHLLQKVIPGLPALLWGLFSFLITLRVLFKIQQRGPRLQMHMQHVFNNRASSTFPPLRLFQPKLLHKQSKLHLTWHIKVLEIYTRSIFNLRISCGLNPLPGWQTTTFKPFTDISFWWNLCSSRLSASKAWIQAVLLHTQDKPLIVCSELELPAKNQSLILPMPESSMMLPKLSITGKDFGDFFCPCWMQPCHCVTTFDGPFAGLQTCQEQSLIHCFALIRFEIWVLRLPMQGSGCTNENQNIFGGLHCT